MKNIFIKNASKRIILIYCAIMLFIQKYLQIPN